MTPSDVNRYMNDLWQIVQKIYLWEKSIANLIRNNPILLFTFGFIMLGLTIIILGRLLSRE